VKDRGAFSLGFLVTGNLWAMVGLTSCKEGVQYPSFGVGLVFLFLGVYGVYKTYVAKEQEGTQAEIDPPRRLQKIPHIPRRGGHSLR
jgi:hypothetical protein